MQDIHSIGGGDSGGLLFGGERRLRPNHHQALKCPRCDSLNTKFCYYNNYNLSQPRHFCKTCRRYWTKGGVLRNVPVGGGCRKNKRSKPKQPPSSDDDDNSTPLPATNYNSHSSSDSSNLTTTTTIAAAAAVAEVVSDSRVFHFQATNNSFDQPLMDQSSDGRIFQEMGSLTGLMKSSNDPSFVGFNIADISYRLQQNQQGPGVQNQGQNEQSISEAEVFDRTAQIGYSGLMNRTSNGGVAAQDWAGGGDQGLFEITGAVDHGYWSQTQWGELDHSLNILP